MVLKPHSLLLTLTALTSLTLVGETLLTICILGRRRGGGHQRLSPGAQSHGRPDTDGCCHLATTNYPLLTSFIFRSMLTVTGASGAPLWQP